MVGKDIIMTNVLLFLIAFTIPRNNNCNNCKSKDNNNNQKNNKISNNTKDNDSNKGNNINWYLSFCHVFQLNSSQFY